ncbi:MAG TPA: outer membrane beta-barrel protein [Thermoanaerobaculia bacterium]|nr:outer membrane beta-barrel protein [Thermoanaerobaculia bacterium]
MKTLAAAALLLALTLPLAADDWSLGIATGPFIFGDFYERRLRPVTTQGEPAEPVTLTLSAATRAGLNVDVERAFADRWAVRLEGTFTRAPLSIKESGDDGVEFDTGDIDVTTITLPLVFRINPHGTFRFDIHGGPAHAIYKTEPSATTPTVHGETNHEWGITFGGGVAWWFSDRFAVEGNLTDIVTTSPYSELEDQNITGLDVKKPHNVHTTVGIRWRF